MRRDGSNLASVLSLVERERGNAHTRVIEFLSKVVPGVKSVSTSHSPDLLDDKSVSAEWLLAVANMNGETKIDPIDEAGRSAIKGRLYTAGELLRQGQLEPDLQRIEEATPKQLSLFTGLDA